MGTCVWSSSVEAIGDHASHYIPPLLDSWQPCACGLWFDLPGAKLSWAWMGGHWLRSWAQAANGCVELRDGWGAGTTRHGTIRTLLVAGRCCPLTAGPLLSAASRTASNARAMRGWSLVLRRLTHSRSRLGVFLGDLLAGFRPAKQSRPRWDPKGRWCHAKVTFDGLPRDRLQLWMPWNDWLFSSQLAVHGRGRRGEVSELAIET